MLINEVFDNLLKNPSNIYEAFLTCGERVELSLPEGYFYFTRFDAMDKTVGQNSCGGGFNGNIRHDLCWRLKRIEIPWQEAIQHWLDGRKVVCKVEERENYYPRPGGFNTISENELANGKWYLV